MSEVVWAVIPWIDLWPMTQNAAIDVLSQQMVKTRLLLVANDCTDESLREAEAWVGEYSRSWDLKEPRVLLWNHRPALPALGGTWNEALRFCFTAGAKEVLVANNDVRLHPRTVGYLLEALIRGTQLFISAVNAGGIPEPYDFDLHMKGGPDYSCFLISRECFEKYPFDPELTYCSDLDQHRRILLAGEGDRIFSVNVPYHHLASRTIADLPEEKSRVYREAADAHRAYYARKWGGGVNEETFSEPWGKAVRDRSVTTPDLFNQVRAKW